MHCGAKSLPCFRQSPGACFHAETGELLWEPKANSGIMGAPFSCQIDGAQVALNE